MAEPIYTIYSDDFGTIEHIWATKYNHKEWKIVSCIKRKWDWYFFCKVYQMKVQRLTPEEMESPLYKIHDGDIFKALADCVGVGAQIHKMIRDIKIERRLKNKSQQP